MAQKLGMAAIILINCYPNFSGKLGDRSGKILSLNILYFTCTLNFRPKFEHRRHPVLPNFWFISQVIEFEKNQGNIFWNIFSEIYTSSPDNTLSKF